MTADEAGRSVLFDFITGKYNNLLLTGLNYNFTVDYSSDLIFLKLTRPGLLTKRTKGDFNERILSLDVMFCGADSNADRRR